MWPVRRATFFLLSCVAALGCQACQATGGPKDAADEPQQGEVIARINGLPVFKSDYVAALQTGRLGGAPELVLDELLGLTLVAHECEAMAGKAVCSGPGTLLERTRPFLERLFSPERTCGVIRDTDYAVVYDRLAGRRFPAGADPYAPEVRLVVEAMLCQGRARNAQRAYVAALRKGARVEIDKDAWAAATAETTGGVPGE